MTSVGHVRRALGDPPPFVQPKTRQRAGRLDDDDEADEADEAGDGDKPDTMTRCGGCSRPIESGFEYHRDDGKAYHNGRVPLTATRPRNRPQAAQGAPQQAGKPIAGIDVQLGAGRPQNA